VAPVETQVQQLLAQAATEGFQVAGLVVVAQL
jgi:hypothetical protein